MREIVSGLTYRSFCSIPINILVNEVYPDTHFGQAHKINGMEKIYIESILSIWVFIILTWTSIPFNDIKSFVVYISYCDKYFKCKHTYNFKVWGLRFVNDWNFMWSALFHATHPMSHNAKFVLKEDVKILPGPGKPFLL